MGSPWPYYRARMPHPQREDDYVGDGLYVDLTNVRLPAFPDPSTAVAQAQAGFDARAAAFVRTCVAPHGGWVPDPEHPDDPDRGTRHGPVQVFPEVEMTDITILGMPVRVQAETSSQPRDLLELKYYGDWAPQVHLVRSKALAALAYPDYFPDTLWRGLDAMVSEALLAAGPGWCGTFGPGISDTSDVVGGVKSEGNYDMNQLSLLTIAYRYFGRLTPEAREHLITVLLARGRIRRVSIDDTFTAGPAPVDWSRAGYTLPHVRIGETENHMIMMMTTRYLTNQLLHQRDPIRPYDNRRNDPRSMSEYVGLVQDGMTEAEVTAKLARDRPGTEPFGGSCTAILLSLLQSFLRDDFNEYNAKNYQNETRRALVALCSYAYDHEVRLGARMVLDYLAGRMVTTSSDLRRMLPFRRRNQDGRSARTAQGIMTVELLHGYDADPMAPFYALHAGNVRAYDHARPWVRRKRICHVYVDGGDQLMDALGEYRIPAPVHDLFVNDARRRFYQRLHRTVRDDENATGNPHNVDNVELSFVSPSYVITAGGQPADYAIDPRFAGVVVGDQDQQLGVAVTTSFMPTVRDGDAVGHLTRPRVLNARDLIQLGGFVAGLSPFPVAHLGVAPDFACGVQVYVPDWFKRMGGVLRPDGEPAYVQEGDFTFLDRGSSDDGSGQAYGPGYYLALYQRDGFGCLEAFDTWHDPRVSFAQFRDVVFTSNLPVADGGPLDLRSDVEGVWTTFNGTRIRFLNSRTAALVSVILGVEYSGQDPLSATGDAGNDQQPFVNGGVLNSPQDSVVTLTNALMNATITLDMADHLRPRRIDETGAVEQAGARGEVWLDPEWAGEQQGDVCLPYGTLARASAEVAEGGTVRVTPGTSAERGRFGDGKAMRLLAPAGGARIGAR